MMMTGDDGCCDGDRSWDSIPPIVCSVVTVSFSYVLVQLRGGPRTQKKANKQGIQRNNYRIMFFILPGMLRLLHARNSVFLISAFPVHSTSFTPKLSSNIN